MPLLEIYTGELTKEQFIEHLNKGKKLIAWHDFPVKIGDRFSIFGQPAQVIRLTNEEEYLWNCPDANEAPMDKQYYYSELSLD